MKVVEFQKCLSKVGVDFAILFDADSYLSYFAGVKAERACLVIPKSGKSLLFVPGFEADRLSKESDIEVVKTDRDLLGNVKSRFSGSRVGVFSDGISYQQALALQSAWKCELVDVEGLARDLRVVKSREEINRISKACAFTDVLFDELVSNFHLFKSEVDASAFLKSRMALFGLEPSFSPIVASGRNAATPHHVPSQSKLSGFTVIDFGVVYKNYCSDMTRTVFVGSPSSADKKVYDKVLSVQGDCVDRVLSDVSLDYVDGFAREKLGKFFVHRIGHSLGVEVHDVQPRPWIFRPGNVVTVEPGFYTDKLGIRIEDEVLVTNRGAITLNWSSKALISIR